MNAYYRIGWLESRLEREIGIDAAHECYKDCEEAWEKKETENKKIGERNEKNM